MTFAGPHAPETRERIASALRGKPRPPEVRARIAAGKRGVKATAEHRANISAARKRDGGIASQWEDPAFRAEHRRRCSADMARRWREDPAFVARHRARSIEQGKRQRLAKLARFAADALDLAALDRSKGEG